MVVVEADLHLLLGPSDAVAERGVEHRSQESVIDPATPRRRGVEHAVVETVDISQTDAVHQATA